MALSGLKSDIFRGPLSIAAADREALSAQGRVRPAEFTPSPYRSGTAHEKVDCRLRIFEPDADAWSALIQRLSISFVVGILIALLIVVGAVCSVGQPTIRPMASNKTLLMALAAPRMSQSEPA
jgi:hypothetical protein